MTSYANTKIDTSTQEVNNISTNVDTVSANIDSHIADSSIHLTVADATNFDSKAAGDHKHLNDGTVTVSAANITGLIPIERIDPSVLERNVTVSSYEEMMSLTKSEIQNGDSVFINGTKQSAWFVVDDTKLGEETYKAEENTISDTSRLWQSVCYGNGKFVAVADDSYFAYSTDGITWTEGTISSTSRSWESVCYGNNKFVAVAYNTNYFAYSTDGITWTEGTISDTNRKWGSVCYGNDKFVAIAVSTTIFAYSMDGITWTEGVLPNNSFWYSVCYGNGKFVITPYSTNYFAYSTDGINWTEGTISSTSKQWYSICYGNDKYVSVTWNSNYSASITFSPAGLIQYAAPAKDLTWENITNKPSTLAEYNITNCYTKDEINALYNTIIENLNSIKTKATNLSNQITVDIPSDLDTTIETNTTTANELNNKLDILIKNASLDDALKNQILSLVENDMVGSMNVTMTRTINITYSWDVDSNGPGLSSTLKIPTGTSYTIDLNNPIEDIYTVDETYTSGMTDEHGDTGYYEFSGWSY